MRLAIAITGSECIIHICSVFSPHPISSRLLFLRDTRTPVFLYPCLLIRAIYSGVFLMCS